MAIDVHESPPSDNNPTGLTSRGVDDDQLRIGDYPLEQTVVGVGTPSDISPTATEQARIDRLMETNGLDYLTAVAYAVPSDKSVRIIGHIIASQKAAEYAQGASERKTERATPLTDQELIDLIRITPTNSSGPGAKQPEQ